jgi:endo-1,3(4)-beta-glucanase
MAFTDTIATTAPPFNVRSAAHPLAPSTYFTYTGTKVLPTNAWWQNLLIPHYDSSTYNGKTATFPYAHWPSSNGKGYTVTYFGSQTGEKDVANRAITLSGAKDVSLEINETITTRQITDYTDLGVSLRFNASAGNMAVNFVQGQGFNSAIYTTTTPVLRFEGAVLAINGGDPASANLSAVTKLRVQTNRFNRVWLVYLSTAASFTYSGGVLTATSTYTGTIQTAILESTSDTASEAVYDAARTSVLTGGTVNSTFSGNTAALTFTFSSTGSGAPLVFALPHHQDLMTSATYTTATLSSLKGTMRAIRASSWTMNEELTSITWRSPNAIPTSAYADIQASLAIEKNSTYDYIGNGYGWSPYYGGKYIAKMARLILIAEEVGDTATATEIATKLKTLVSSYLNATPTGSKGTNGSGYVNTLQYQGGSTWKGVSTQNGLEDMGADFGSGRFNDHHFHYGYWIFTAAVLARNDTTWRANNKAAVESLIRDIANPSHSDTYFPKFRHKDWFAGHSYASGLVGLDVGPGQESTSEAINAWYGVLLWGVATSNTDISNMGRLLLAGEVRSAKRYWHIYENSDIYPAPFNQNGTAVVLRTHKVAVETYFGSKNHYFYGIQSLPFTPISEIYIDQPWVQRSYATASSEIPTTSTTNPQDTAWDSVIYSFHAVIDPTAGYAEAKALTLEQIPEYTTSVQYGRRIDNGHSKSNALAWASTRTATAGGSVTATTTTLSLSPATTATAGASVTLTALISPSAASGTVVFRDGSTTIGTVTVSNGVATYTTTALATGTRSLSALFTSSNTATYTSSSSPTVSYGITSGQSEPGSGGAAGSNKNAVSYMSFTYGQPLTSVRTAIADTNYSVARTDAIVAYTSITTDRSVTLPSISSVPNGWQIVIKDESGDCSGAVPITIIGTIDNATNRTITTAYGSIIVYAGLSSWYTVA